MIKQHKLSGQRRPVFCIASALPLCLEARGIAFAGELDLTPEDLIRELPGSERRFFRAMFAGKLAKKIYRLYKFRKECRR